MPASMGFAVSLGLVETAVASTWGGRTKEEVWTLSSTTVHDVGETGGLGDFERILRLLTHEDTTELSERQLMVLKRLCKVHQNGFGYHELALVGQLLPLVEKKTTYGETAGDFHAILLKLLSICSLAPLRNRANEEFTKSGLIASSSLLRVLGGTLWSSDRSIQSATAEALRKIVAGNDPTRPNTPDEETGAASGKSLDDLRPKPRDINQALLLGCGVVSSAVECLGNIVGSVLESLADLDDFSLESSSFGDSESDFHAETQLARRGLGEHAVALESGEEGRDVLSSADAPAMETVGPLYAGQGATTVSDVAAKYSVLVSILRFVRELSTNAASSATMVETGLVSLLVQVLRAVRGIRDPTLSVSVEILWNCLEHSCEAMTHGPPAKSRTNLIRKARKSNAAYALSTWDGVSALRDTIEALLIGGFRRKDKELRNEAVIVVSQLGSNCRSHSLFRSAGMLQLLLRYATAIETGLADGDPQAAGSEARTAALAADECNKSEMNHRGLPELGPLADPRNFATMTEVDLELKLLLWSLLAELSKRDSRNLEVIKASPLMETLLMYTDLVIEEGPCADAAAPGMSRSVSLASMPPVGSTSQASSPVAATATRTGVEQLGCNPLIALGSTKHEANASSPCASATLLGEGTAPSPGAIIDDSQERAFRPPEKVAADATQSDVWDRGQEGNRSGGRPMTGATQLYVPATVVRLPVTSIQLLQGQAMASLLVLAPRFPRKFQALGGHMVTLRLLDRLGSRPENQELVKAATKMLATVVGLPGLKEELGRMDGVRIMLDRFSEESKRGAQSGGCGVEDTISSGRGGVEAGGSSGSTEGGGDLRTNTVVILCRLCEDCRDNQEAFRKAGGIPMLMSAIKGYCRARSEAKQAEAGGVGVGGSGSGGGGGRSAGAGSGGALSLGTGGNREGKTSSDECLDPSLVHIVDCVWCAVVGNRRSEARLLQCEGLDTLLDLLEVCPVVMRHQVTGVVADLLRNKRSIPYARAWRSDLNMLSVSQLMVRLWVAEESRMGVSRPNGVLQNLWQPLQSHGRGIGRRGAGVQSGDDYRSGSRSQNARSPSMENTYCNGKTSDARPLNPHDGSTVCPPDAAVDVNNNSTDRSISGSAIEAVRTENSDNDLGTARCDSTLTPDAIESGGDTNCVTVVQAADDAGNTNSTASVEAVALALQTCRRGLVRRGGPGEGKRGQIVDGEAAVVKAMEQLDLRGKIAAVLGMVGFDVNSTEGLEPSELKASYMATSYLNFRAGEAWQEVAAELEAQHVNPIAADGLVLDTMLERAFDRAHEVKSKQTALTAEQGARDGAMEEIFFAGILFQRDQEIRQAIIKRNALMPGASKKRLAAKRAKEAMLKASGQQPSVEGGSDAFGLHLELGTPDEAA